MKYIFVLMLALVVQLNSQEKLTFVNGGKVLNEAGYKINSEVVKLILKDNPAALDLYTTGRDKKTAGNILLISGFAFATVLLFIILMHHQKPPLHITVIVIIPQLHQNVLNQLYIM